MIIFQIGMDVIFFFAKGVVSGLLDSRKNDIKSIMVYDRETFNILKQVKKIR